jgi:DNA-binding NtrC family response regulator
MRLVVEEGYNRGVEYVIGADVVLLGRGGTCDVPLLENGVSRRHAEIYQEDGRIFVRDLESRNGTILNGVPVTRAELAEGDRLALGGVRFLVLLGAGPAGRSTRGARTTAMIEVHEDGKAATRPPLSPGQAAEEFLGASPPMRALFAQIARIAPAECTTLVRGESGTGKELVARALHRLSPRRRAPFVVLNCAALPTELAESELFGHEKGAFTGAHTRKVGLLEAAHGGTLFLDELGELPLGLQAKLLRFLESGEVVRVGATRPLRSDVRLVAATHRDLERMAGADEFRGDLLFRLRVVELRLPPLRERGGDVELLAESFLKGFAAGRRRFTAAALRALRAHPWPGNVRELKNVVEAAVILTDGPAIDLSDLPERLRGGAHPELEAATAPALPPLEARAAEAPGEATPPEEILPPILPLKDVERRAIVAALARFDGHRSKTAEALGIDRKTLYLRLKEFGLG